MPWFRIVQFALLVSGIIIGASRFRRLTYSSRLYWTLLIFTTFTEIISWQLGKQYGNNVVVSRIFLPVQFALIAAGYMRELDKYKVALVSSLIVVAIAAVLDAIFHRHVLLEEYPALLKAICSILIVGWSLVYLRELLNQRTDSFFTEYPLFWISVGWLLFTIITYFGFTAFNFIYSQDLTFITLFWYLRIAANFILYTLICIALLSYQRALL